MLGEANARPFLVNFANANGGQPTDFCRILDLTQPFPAGPGKLVDHSLKSTTDFSTFPALFPVLPSQLMLIGVATSPHTWPMASSEVGH